MYSRRQSTLHANTSDECVVYLVLLKFTRFPVKDKSETLSSKYVVLLSGNNETKIENVLQNATLSGYCLTNFAEILQKINIDNLLY